MSHGHILVVDDERSICDVLRLGLTRAGHRVKTALSIAEARSTLADDVFDLLITDLQLPDGDGISLLQQVKAASPETAVIVLTAHGSADTAVAAMRLGAHDYLTKPFDIDELRIKVDHAIEGRRLLRENRELRAEVSARQGLDGIIGTSKAIHAVVDRIRAVADSTSTVLILGESGTGKELVARALHRQSARSKHSFVAVNCGALTETLLESELFGHVRGAFTDAHQAKAGLIEKAHQGTLFLDEVGEMSLAMQVKLLRVLQERQVRRVGASEEFPVDIRVVAATNRDLSTMVQNGRFREDLFYRINVIPILIPPLRERAEDIPALVEAFVLRFAKLTKKNVRGVSAEARRAMLAHSWPGNVRELENTVERAVALETSEFLGTESLFLPPLTVGGGVVLGEGFCLPDHLSEVERQLAQKAMTMASGQRTEAARLLGIKYRALNHILAKAGQ